MKLFRTVLVFMLLSLVNPIFSQYPSDFEIDSLRTVFNNSSFEDSVRLGALYKIRNELKDTSIINSAIEIAKKLEDSVKIKYFDNRKFILIGSDSLWGVWTDNKISDSLRLDAIIRFSESFFWNYLFQKLSGKHEQFRLLIENDTSYVNLAYEFAKSKGFNKQISTIFAKKGTMYAFNGGNILEQIKCLNKEIYHNKLIKDVEALASNYNRIGELYLKISNYERALYFCKQSISISTEFDYLGQLTFNYISLANIYKAQNNNQKAKEYYEKFLDNNELSRKNEGLLIETKRKLATLYNEDENYEEALELYNSCIKTINERDYEDDFVIAKIYIGIANTYSKMNLHVKAVEFYEKAFEKVNKKKTRFYYYDVWLSIIEYYHYIGNLKKTNQYIDEYLNLWPKYIAVNIWKTKNANGLIKIAEIQADNGEFNNAIKNLKRAKNLSKESLAIETEKRANFSLYRFYKKVGNQANALLMHEAYVHLSDSLAKIDGIEKEKQNEIKEYFKLQNQADSIKRAEEIILHQAEAKTQKQRSNGLVLISIIILISLGLVFTQLKKVKKGKLLVEERNIVIEEKQKEITDSINYAKRLQDGILVPLDLVQSWLSESFILFKPKDIVSGDFYWIEKVGDKIYFAVADCTGHGIPGALVSIICSNALSKSLQEDKISSPAKILDATRQLVEQRFVRAVDSIKDGMDISLCCLNVKTKTITWAGAMNPLWVVKKDLLEIQEIKPDRQAIGRIENPKPFTEHKIKLSAGDSVYLFSDGYPDQFGGPKGKKYMKGKMKKYVLSIQNQSMQEQLASFDKEFNSWKGSQDQIDDVCVMGVRIT